MDKLDPGPPAPPDPAVQAATLDWLPKPDPDIVRGIERVTGETYRDGRWLPGD
jgi:hypothetical protein